MNVFFYVNNEICWELKQIKVNWDFQLCMPGCHSTHLAKNVKFEEKNNIICKYIVHMGSLHFSALSENSNIYTKLTRF